VPGHDDACHAGFPVPLLRFVPVGAVPGLFQAPRGARRVAMEAPAHRKRGLGSGAGRQGAELRRLAARNSAPSLPAPAGCAPPQ
jgi:hypothetical protein